MKNRKEASRNLAERRSILRKKGPARAEELKNVRIQMSQKVHIRLEVIVDDSISEVPGIFTELSERGKTRCQLEADKAKRIDICF